MSKCGGLKNDFGKMKNTPTFRYVILFLRVLSLSFFLLNPYNNRFDYYQAVNFFIFFLRLNVSVPISVILNLQRNFSRRNKVFFGTSVQNSYFWSFFYPSSNRFMSKIHFQNIQRSQVHIVTVVKIRVS